MLIYVRPGEKDPAFECAQKAYQEHSGLLACLNVAPRVGGVRSEARFQE